MPRLKKQHDKTASVRNDFLYKHTTIISKNHAVVVMEDPQIRNLSRSASGLPAEPRHAVRAKRD